MREPASARLDAGDGVRCTTASAHVLRLCVVGGATVLLTSVAGVAVYAAAVTVPLLAVVAVTSRGRGWRVAATVVAALTFLEVTWMLAWVLWRSVTGSFVVGLGAALVLTQVFRKATLDRRRRVG